MSTLEELTQKIKRKEPLTSSERLILMVYQTAKYRREPNFEREMMESMIQDKDFTEEEREALEAEILKLTELK